MVPGISIREQLALERHQTLLREAERESSGPTLAGQTQSSLGAGGSTRGSAWQSTGEACSISSQ
jgi:hypothetical protein